MEINHPLNVQISFGFWIYRLKDECFLWSSFLVDAIEETLMPPKLLQVQKLIDMFLSISLLLCSDSQWCSILCQIRLPRFAYLLPICVIKSRFRILFLPSQRRDVRLCDVAVRIIQMRIRCTFLGKAKCAKTASMVCNTHHSPKRCPEELWF